MQSLQSFGGMVNYLRRFSPVLTELSEPLRRLQKWAWESEQQTAFEKIKTALTTLPVLTYFNKDKAHIIQTDASKTGLGAVLQQEGQPVVYASRALTDTERRYSNIERELLGVVFGLKRLHHYTFGKSFTVETDTSHSQVYGKRLLWLQVQDCRDYSSGWLSMMYTWNTSKAEKMS